MFLCYKRNGYRQIRIKCMKISAIKSIFRKKKPIIFIVILFLVWFSYFENNAIVISNYGVKSDRLPKSFENFKIVQISDLHNKVFYKDNSSLVSKITSQNPDIIVITGDLVDRRKYNEDNAISFIDKIKAIAPIYYVNGNHEGWSGKFASLERKLKDKGVFVLRNESIDYVKGKEKIIISGADDPSFNTSGYYEDIISKELFTVDDDKYFRILLSHRPELFNYYVHNNTDVAFSGHAHGGQVIVPFLGGVVAPNQGFLPKYYSGLYTENKTTMVVSRGLGNSTIPQRLFNRPEIVTMTLNSGEN
jgi:predicted MPP superfamily phosphohydrolase